MSETDFRGSPKERPLIQEFSERLPPAVWGNLELLRAELLALLEVVRLLLALRVQVLEVPPGQLRGSKEKAGVINCSIECW